MNAQAGNDRSEQSLYATGLKEAGKLETEYNKKANIIQKAYEAAVAELGYNDKELMDASKAKNAAKLMFSDKYLGNTKFNPLLKESELYKGFGEKGEIDQQRLYEHMLSMNLNTFVGNGGIIDRYGGLRRGSITEAADRQFNSQTIQQLSALAWQKVYDTDKSLGENIDNYAKVLQEDPILAHTGAKLNAGKFESIDEAAQALATSFIGRSTRENFQYKHGVDFN